MFPLHQILTLTDVFDRKYHSRLGFDVGVHLTELVHVCPCLTSVLHLSSYSCQINRRKSYEKKNNNNNSTLTFQNSKSSAITASVQSAWFRVSDYDIAGLTVPGGSSAQTICAPHSVFQGFSSWSEITFCPCPRLCCAFVFASCT